MEPGMILFLVLVATVLKLMGVAFLRPITCPGCKRDVEEMRQEMWLKMQDEGSEFGSDTETETDTDTDTDTDTETDTEPDAGSAPVSRELDDMGNTDDDEDGGGSEEPDIASE
jgi:hypothetical protein